VLAATGVNLLGILGDEGADSKGLARRRVECGRGTLATEGKVWDRPSLLSKNSRLRNDLLCVEWDVKPYTLTHSPKMVFSLEFSCFGVF